MASLVREAAANSLRCGHSISTGATARNNGPGNSRAPPISASPMASSMTISESRSASAGAQNGSAGTKSMVPATLVFNPSVEKRVIARIPDSPAVRRRQFSLFPAPSDVMIPIPVTTTMGRPALSRVACMFLGSPRSIDGFDERHALAPPVPDAGYDRLSQGTLHRALDRRSVAGREQYAMAHREGRKSNIHRKLRLHPVPEPTAGRAHRCFRMLRQKTPLLAGGRLDAGCSRQNGVTPGLKPGRDRLPHAPQCICYGAGVPTGAARKHERKLGERLRTAGLRVGALFQHQERPERPQRKSRRRAARPDRPVLVLEDEAAEFVEQHQILALRILGTAYEGKLALACGNAGKRDPRRVDAGRLLAHEGARRPSDTMNDGNIA